MTERRVARCAEGMAQDDPSDNRREHERVPMNIIVQYRFDSIEDFVAEYARDISLGGIFIRTPDVRPVGAHVYLQFAVKDGRRLIEGLGRVVRTVPSGEGAGMGIAFTSVDRDSRELIERLVAEREREEAEG